MPQNTIEYTTNIVDEIDKDNFLLEIHKIINKSAGINIENCKSRLIKIENYFIAKGEKENAFVHTHIQFLEGRNEEVRIKLGEEILNFLKMYFQESISNLNVQITVFIEDFPKKYYFKFPEGTFV